MRAQPTPLRCGPTPLQSLLLRRWRPGWVCASRLGRPALWLGARRSHATQGQKAQDEKPYYVTTPIFYVNAAPHVGHMYSMVVADVLKRWQQVKGRRAVLCTGTDEHGLKVQQAAAAAGMEPRALCDRHAGTFAELAARMELSHDVFVRTSEARHRAAVGHAWQMLEQRGLVYEGRHEGWYSVSDETFYPAGQVQLVVDPPTGRKVMVSIETGKEVEWTSERNYHFRLSAFRERLLEWYAQNPRWIVPAARMDEVVREVTEGLRDLSVSRPASRLTWGIPVPGDESQTIYVWLDALMNYATAAGYPFTPGREGVGGWPADVHVIGKDIVRFHCIYWPAFLMALELPLPGRILTHGHWTLGKHKMAKSTGNVVDPFFALERFGTDALRWYLVHDGGIGQDADYDNGFVMDKYKKGLQGGVGNLTGRIMRGRGWDVGRAVRRFAGDLAAAKGGDEASRHFYGFLRVTPRAAEKQMRALLPNKALQAVMKLVYDANAYLQKASPWTLAGRLKEMAAETAETTEPRSTGPERKDVEEEMDRVVYLNAEALRLVGIMLQAFTPSKASRMLDMLGVKEERRSWEWCAVGKDDEYGVPMVDLGRNEKGVLFPGLSSDC